jgi:hypothetical protein
VATRWHSHLDAILPVPRRFQLLLRSGLTISTQNQRKRPARRVTAGLKWSDEREGNEIFDDACFIVGDENRQALGIFLLRRLTVAPLS